MQTDDFKDSKLEGICLAQLSTGGKKFSHFSHTTALGVCFLEDTDQYPKRKKEKEECKSVQRTGVSLHEKVREAWNSKILFANDSSENFKK